MFKINALKLSLLIVFSILNTLVTLVILYFINEMVAGNQVLMETSGYLTYFGVVLFSFVLNIFFQRQIIDLSNDYIFENEINILEKIRYAKLGQVEKIGKDRFYAILEDLRSLVFIPYALTGALNAVIVLLVGFLYFFYISFTAAFAFFGIVALLVVFYFVQNKSIQVKGETSRSLNDYYFKILRDYIDGFKGLKMNSKKNNTIYNDFLAVNRKSAKDMEVEVSKSFLALNLLGQYGLYIILGIVIFIFPLFNIIERSSIGSFVILILFLSGPINSLINLQGFIMRLRVAIKRIKAFISDLEVEPNDEVKALTGVNDFETIAFNQVEYRYPETNFGMGPIDLSIKKGEVIFIIGGNGSGKSTFLNLFTNLYAPVSGNITVNGEEVGEDNLNYRDLFSVVFTDNHLYSENYDDYKLEGNQEYEDLLKTMELDKVVADDSEESARKNYSKGQSKRMALIFALLEKRPLLVLDEWAAEQDPYFRRYFYETLIPKLKQEGKTIIAVTHDDAYFKYADRILKFDYGTIVKDVSTKENVLDKEISW